jgi:hypothetical protein
MSCIAPAASPCPCGTPEFPAQICNPPGLPAIAYRAGDYLAFRHRLLQPLPAEQELTQWQPGATGDLAVQMIEWWAYLADILTFYNERFANEQYLGTALQPASVNHLVQLLGYRPRPALGSRGTLAALLTSTARLPVTLPAGMQIQSKPAPGASPQIFELDQTVQLTAPDIISAQAVPASAPLCGADGGIWLAGKVSGIKPGDHLLLINAQAITAQAITAQAITAQTIADFAWISAGAAQNLQDPLGNNVTALSFTVLAGTLAAGAQAADYVLLRAAQNSPLWPYPTISLVVSDSGPFREAIAVTPGAGIGRGRIHVIPDSGVIHLAGLARGLTTGSLFLLDVPAGTGLNPTPLIVQSYNELVWYANCGEGNDASVSPSSSATPPTPPIAVLHSQISVASLTGDWNSNAASVTLRYGFAPVGTLVPVLTAAALNYAGGVQALVPLAGNPGFPPAPAPVLLEDGNFNAAAGITAAAASPAGGITLGNVSTAPPPAGLAAPVAVLFNLLAVSRGQTVAAETLGSGSAVVISQDFTLKNSPVTYFADPNSASGNPFSSTVKVSVDGVQWAQARSFYGQPATAQVFVLYEDDSGQTHVSFGDGANGMRPPTGTNNIIATYRYGAGAAAPAAETLTVVQTPQPGLKAVRNPLPPTGGADADAAADVATLAPRSVLTFNRAVSLDDYAAIAATGGGVTQAVAVFGFDATAQRPLVQVWVAGDAGAAAAATTALNGVAMPNQAFTVNPATAIPVTLALSYFADPRFADPAIRAGLTAALTGAGSLFGANGMAIGQAVYDSQIEAACLAVPGVTAVRDLSFATGSWRLPIIFRLAPRRRVFSFRPAPVCAGHRHDPGAGHYYTLAAAALTLNPGAAS